MTKSWHGLASEFVAKQKCGSDFEWKERAFQQTSMCNLTQVVSRLVSIRDSVLIVHGPIGCSIGANNYREIYKKIPGHLNVPEDWDLNFLSTNLTEKDIVFGGEGKLRSTILEAVKRYEPKSIIISTSCASGVMGDDIEGVVEALQPQLEATLVPIRCEGFRSGISQTSFDAAGHAIVKYLVKEPRQKQKDLVGIIAPFSVTWADRVEIKRLFDKLGLRPLFIPDFATTEELQYLSEAAVIAPTCASYGHYLQEALNIKYGVPYFRDPAPLGLEKTATWLREIAKYTGKEKEVEALIKEELEIVVPQLEKLKVQLKDKKASIFIAAGQARMVFIPRFAHELGLDVAGVNTLELDNYLNNELVELYEDIGEFEIHAADHQSFENAHLLERVKPDIHTSCPFMGLYKRDASHVRNHSFRSDFSIPANQFVFRGVINYGTLLLNALNNQAVPKTLAQKAKKPYKNWWFEQPNMFAYVKENQV